MPLLDQGLLLLFEVLLKLFLAVEFLHEEIVVLLVGLLDVSGDLLGMGLFQSLDCFVILFEFLQLLFKFSAPVVKALFQLNDLILHFFDLLAVELFQLLFLGFDLTSVALESLLGFLALGLVVPFELTDLVFPTGAVLGLLEGVFLLGDDSVGGDEESLDFLLVGVVAGLLGVGVLFIFAVEMEDDLGKLGDLLRHLVMRLFRNGRHDFNLNY